MKSKLKLLLVVLLIQSTSACIQIDTSTTTPTIGDQIVDLVKAKNLGAISEEEYERLRSMALASF